MTKTELILWLDFFFRSFFFGFTVWTFYWIFSSRKLIAGHTLENVDEFIAKVAIYFGIYHIAFLAMNFVNFSEGFQANQELIDRATGPYWFGFWVFPFCYFGMTQLFWWKSLRKSKVIRIVVAIAVFSVMHIEKFVIVVTSLHAENTTDPWTFIGRVGLNQLVDWVIYLVIFGLFLFAYLRSQPISKTAESTSE